MWLKIGQSVKTPGQFSLAWLMAQNSFIVLISGTTNAKHMLESIGAVSVKPTQDELKEIRSSISKIRLVGVRPSESAMKDQ